LRPSRTGRPRAAPPGTAGAFDGDALYRPPARRAARTASDNTSRRLFHAALPVRPGACVSCIPCGPESTWYCVRIRKNSAKLS